MSDPGDVDADVDAPASEPTPVAGSETGALRRAGRAAARSVRGLVGIGIAVIVIGVIAIVPLGSIRHSPQSLSITPLPAPQQLVCPGALVRLGDEGGKDATSARNLGNPVTVSAASQGSVVSTSIGQADESAGTAGAPLVLGVSAGEDTAIAGAQSQTAHSGDFRGFGAVQCAEASTSTWLVGGSTAVGRTTILSLANPNDFVATADVAVFGSDGEVASAGSSGILIAARSTKVVSLAGFAPDVAAPVVHVTSTGGSVLATLQQAVVRGIEPGGVDFIGPAASASKAQVFPGLVVRNAEGVAELLGEEGYEDARTVLRVFVPGDESTAATVSVVPEDTEVAGATFTVDLEPGVVSEIPFDGLDDGTYAVTVVADQPTLAALRASTVSLPTGTSAANDFAWFAASAPLSDPAFVVIAPGAGGALHLANPGEETETVILKSADGTSRAIEVLAGSSMTVEVTPGASYQLEGFATIYASVSYADAGKLASYPVIPSRTGQAAITVNP